MRAAVSSAGWSPARCDAALTSVESMHVILSVEGSPMGHWGTYPRGAGNWHLCGSLFGAPQTGALRAAAEVGLALGEEGTDDVGGEHGAGPWRSVCADLSTVVLRRARPHREIGVCRPAECLRSVTSRVSAGR